MAGSVLVTVGEAHDKVVPVLAEKARALAIGDGAADGVGSARSSAARSATACALDRSRRARRCDGRSSTAATPDGVNPEGAFVGPTLLTT